MKFHAVDIKSADWHELDKFADRTVFQTREWLQFVAESQNAEPILAELREGNEILGYFSGLTFSKLGMKVLGSSFPGWTTPYIGFNLKPGVPRGNALQALETFAWDDLKCVHLEVSDPNFTFEEGEAAGFEAEYYGSYRSDLTRSQEELFNGMESACRRCIRKAEKSGLKIEEAHDLDFRRRILRTAERCICEAIAGAHLFRGARPGIGPQRRAGRQYSAAASAQSGREVRRDGNLSRFQPDCRILGERQLSRVPKSASK